MTMKLRHLPLLVLVYLVFTAPVVRADEGGRALDLESVRENRAKTLERYGFGEYASGRLADAIEHFQNDELGDARHVLERALRRRLNPLEKASIYRILGYVRNAQEDRPGAIEALQQALAQEALLLDEENDIRFNIAQINAAEENWAGVLEALDEWFRHVESPSSTALFLKALAHYQLDQLEPALEAARQTVAASPEPRESWLQLLVSLHLQTDDYAAATGPLEDLVVKFPRKQYWQQLALIYGAREMYEESLAVQQIAYSQGYLDEDRDVRRLTRSYLYHNLPDPASRVLADELQSGVVTKDAASLELLANSYIAAREFQASLEPLREAAALDESGRLYVRLGQVHIQREEWADAVSVLARALDKRQVDQDQGRTLLLLGIASYSDGEADAARGWFVRASEHESARAEARRWIQHLENSSVVQ